MQPIYLWVTCLVNSFIQWIQSSYQHDKLGLSNENNTACKAHIAMMTNIVHNAMTNEKFILLEFVIEPVEPKTFIFPVWLFDTLFFIFTLDYTDDITLLTPIHTLSIVSVMVANGSKVKSWPGSFEICYNTMT